MNIFARLLLLTLFATAPARAEVVETDVLVFGATAGGVSAACTAAKLGKTVAITEFGKHVGGLTSGGLGWTDIGNKRAIGGFAHEFYERLGKHYGKAESWYFEPSVAEKELRALLAESKAKVYFEQRLAAVKKEGTRIVEITMENGNVFRAKMFIDATYEGDLMAKAGVSYAVGREANAKYGETLNGFREQSSGHKFSLPIDPYVKPGDPSSGLLPFVQPATNEKPGDGDKCVQAYNFRLCLTNVPSNRKPIDPPAGYDEARYELLGRYLDALVAAGKPVTTHNFLKNDIVWYAPPEPGAAQPAGAKPVKLGKTDTNNNGPFSTDFIGMNYAYPDADYAARAKFSKELEDYTRGLLHYLATSKRAPESLRNEMAQWGLCRDEFVDTGGWPHQIYVREARRMVSGYVMTEHNCRGDAKAEDPVGLGAYNMDSHNCERIVRNGVAGNEGDVEVHVPNPYPISYRSIVPKAAESENLLVPVCLSATHIAYGSIRMEPVFMVLGQSAGTAACLAIDARVPAQKVDYTALKARLLEQKQILDWTPAPQPSPTK